MNRATVPPVRLGCTLLGVLVLILATIALPSTALSQTPAGGSIPIPTPVVPTLPVGAGEVGLTIILLMLGLFGLAGVTAELSRMKEEREARQGRTQGQIPDEALAATSADSPPPRRPAGMAQPRHSH